MKRTIILFALLVSLITFSTSCKKSNDTTADAVSMLMNKNWKLTAGTVSPAFMGHTDFFTLLSACDHDNLMKFMANNVLVYDQGATRCDPLDPQSESGTWSYEATENKIIMAMPDTTNFNILELTNTTLRGTNTQVIGGTTYTYSSTYTAQ